MPSVGRPNSPTTIGGTSPATGPATPASPVAPATLPATGPANSFTPGHVPHVPVVTHPTPARPPPLMPAQDVFPVPPGNNPPLDYTVKVPPALVQRYPKIFFDGADVLSHMELETKWKVDVNDVAGYKAKLDQLCADPQLAQQVLGPGWSVTANLKYVGSPMVDNYDDDPATLAITNGHGVLRDRSVEGDRFNNINIKPDGGIKGPSVFDPVIRAEYDMAVNKEVRTKPGLLNDLIGSGEHLDVMRFLPKFDASKLEVVSTISDVRAKYNFVHSSGLAIEASLDDVDWSSKVFKDANGKPLKVHFAQLEMEKEHLAFAGNAPAPTPGGSAPATATPATPAADPNDPLAWLRNAGGAITMGGAPRIHTPTDLKDPGVRKTPDYATQLSFNKALAGFLYGAKAPEAAEQKNASGFHLAAEQSNDPRLKALLGV